MSKHLLLALAAGGAATAAVIASAASLGSVNSTDLGAGTQVVASCDDEIDVSYGTEFNSTSGEYDVTSITLAGVADQCEGQEVSITLSSASAELDSVDAVVPTYTGTTDALTADLTVEAPAEDVTKIAVVISGDAS